MTDSQHNVEAVRRVLDASPAIREGLAGGLVNVRALARRIQVTSAPRASIEALVAAIRRFPLEGAVERDRAIGELITKLRLKNEIVDVEIRNDPAIPGLLAKFSQRVDTSKGESLSVASSVDGVVVVTDSANLDSLIEVLPRRNVTNITRNLAEVSVTLDQSYKKMVGVIARLTTEIALERINIRDFIHSAPHIGIVVEERDALRTYRAMERLRNKDLSPSAEP
jgi:aspartokinase